MQSLCTKQHFIKGPFLSLFLFFRVAMSLFRFFYVLFAIYIHRVVRYNYAIISELIRKQKIDSTKPSVSISIYKFHHTATKIPNS